MKAMKKGMKKNHAMKKGRGMKSMRDANKHAKK